MDTSDEWITSRTGIKARRIANEKEATSDLAVKAAQNALIDAGITAQDIDLSNRGNDYPRYGFSINRLLDSA